MDCVGATKEAEIMVSLNNLNERLQELKNRLTVVSLPIPKDCEKNSTQEKSIVMQKIMNITELVNETLKGLDII